MLQMDSQFCCGFSFQKYAAGSMFYNIYYYYYYYYYYCYCNTITATVILLLLL